MSPAHVASRQPPEAASPSHLSAPSTCVVLKFGGTSVSTRENWQNIRTVVAARRAQGLQVVVVHSALTGITDQLETLMKAALCGEESEVLRAIEDRHRTLAKQLGVDVDDDLEQRFAERIASSDLLPDSTSCLTKNVTRDP